MNTINRKINKRSGDRANKIFAEIDKRLQRTTRREARGLRRPRMRFPNSAAALAVTILIAALSVVVVAVLLRIISPQSQIIVSPVEILSAFDQRMNTQNSRAMTGLVFDKLHEILEQARSFSGNMYSSKKSLGQIPDMPYIPIETSYGIEINGVSVDQLLATWNHIRDHEFRVSGSVRLQAGGDDTMTLRYVTEGKTKSFSEHLGSGDSVDLEHAISSLSLNLIKDIKPEAAARYLLAVAHLCTGNCEPAWEAAIEFCSDWTKKEPRNAWAFYYLGYALSHTNHLSDALPFLDRALELNTRLFPALNTKGAVLMNQADYTNATEAFKDALRIRKTPNPLVNLGTTAMRQQRYVEAENYYREALAQDSQDAGAYLKLGHVLLLLRKNNEAEEAYRQSRKLEPGNDVALEGLVRSLTAEGRYGDAIRKCEEEARLNPHGGAPHKAEGIVFLQMEQTDPAIEQFNLAIEQFKTARNSQGSNESSYYLGMAFAQRGDLDLARKQLKATLETYPKKFYLSDLNSLSEIHRLMAKVLLAQNDLQGSKKEASEAERLAPWLTNDSWNNSLLLQIFRAADSPATRVSRGAEP